MCPRPHPSARPPHGGRREPPRGRIRAALYSTLAFIARHVGGFWAALAVFLSLGLVVGAAGMFLLALVAGAVITGMTRSVDENTLRWLEARRTPLMDEAMLQVTTLGDGIVLVVLVGVTALFLWLTQHRWSVYILVLGVFGGQLFSLGLKGAFRRPRPDMIEAITNVSTTSFPSGHAMSATLAYGAVAWLVSRLEPTPALRRATWAVAVLTIIAIGFSRMYLGVHYPSDVLAGFAAGVAWLAFVAASLEAVRYFAPRRPQTAGEERGLRQDVPRRRGP
jgi:membrane-associated phospholipid phosphatase